MGLFSGLGSLLGIGGGGGGGFTSGGFASGNDKSTKTETTSTSTITDNRQVNDLGGGVLGNGNQWDSSTSSIDNHAWTSTNTNTNSGNTSWTAKNTNSGNTTTTNNVTDGGAFTTVRDTATIQAQAAAAIASRALDSVDRQGVQSFKFAAQAQDGAVKALGDAAALMQANSAQAFQSSTSAIGMMSQAFASLGKLASDVVGTSAKQADDAAATTAAAYQSAKDATTGDRTLKLAALAAVGIVAAVALYRRG